MKKHILRTLAGAFFVITFSGCALLGGLKSDLEGTWNVTGLSCGATTVTITSGTSITLTFADDTVTFTQSDSDCADAQVNAATYADDTVTMVDGNSTCSPASCTLTDPFSGSTGTCSNGTGDGSTDAFTVTIDGDNATFTQSEDCDGNSGNGEETMTITATKS